MQPYLELVSNVLKNGSRKSNRTGIDTIQIVGTQSRYDLTKGFPATTTKKLFFKGVLHELLWLISGNTNIKYLSDNGVHIWDEWADAEGELGPVYGAMWRRFPGPGTQTTDQISNLINGLRKDPASRRHIVSAWHPGLVSQQALPPCHTLFQFDVDNDGGLSCHLYQRSADIFLGVPFNIASYSLLTHMVAQVTGLKAKEFVHTIHDAHIYSNHIDQCMLQLEREPYELPQIWLNPDIKEIDDFKYEDIKLLNYKSHPPIKGDVAV